MIDMYQLKTTLGHSDMEKRRNSNGSDCSIKSAMVTI
ncbi:hypothetical protein GJ496_007537, partial [Pomphorhynchus laevis]